MSNYIFKGGGFMANNFLKPGDKTPESGQYGLFGSRGGSKGVEITSVKNKPLPPTPEPGMQYKLLDKTKHKKK